jgi:RsiW-degrading membrane proteinase PrsW (M82 family)
MSNEHMDLIVMILIMLIPVIFIALQFHFKNKSKIIDVSFSIFCILSGITLLASILFFSFESGAIYFPMGRTRRLVSSDDSLFLIASLLAAAVSFALIWLGVCNLKQDRKRR